MSKLYLSLLAILLSGYCTAQEIVFDEKFDKISGVWVCTNNVADPEYKNGNLILKSKSKKRPVLTTREVVLDPKQDFSITTSIKYNKGRTKKTFGMVLSDGRFTDKPNNYFFSLYPKRRYQVSYNRANAKKPKDYVPKQKKVAFLKAKGEYNDLELRNANGVFEYYINGQKVWSLKDPGICITSIGFYTNGVQEVHIDDLLVRQNGWNEINQISDSSKIYKKENLGESVNSPADELSPIISADGKTLYLCVEADKANVGADDKQDIWYSTIKSDSTWNKRINLGMPVNNDSHNAVNYVSPDNNSLYVVGTYDKKGKTVSAGLSVVNRKKGGWGIPEPLKIDNFYNRNPYQNVAYSPTGKTMILAIERDDTFGNLDLYVSSKKPDGTWSQPSNMGKVINTYGQECTPYLAADNTTLFFATNARPGYGDSDIFMTKRLDDTWTAWSEPKNLGPNINTPGWDGYFTISASADYSYLVSFDNSLGQGDIFRVKVSEVPKPNVIEPEKPKPLVNPVALVKGQVYNQKSTEFIEASISYFDLDTNQEIGTARSNPDNGSYTISLPAGHKYSYFAQKDGFFSVSDNIDLMELSAFTEITKDLFLAPIVVGQNIRLNNIFFEYDKTNLLESSVYELDRLVTMMTENANMVIQIAGHTDNAGTDTYNQKLSEGRALSVYNYLKNKGLGARASSVGYGESKPIETNETDAGRAVNRRVEFVIISK